MTFRLFHGFLAALGLVFLLQPAQARVGETPEECEKRYEHVVRRMPFVIPGSDPEAVLFEKDQTYITVHFRNGIAWHIAYQGPKVDDAFRRLLLQANVQGDGWRDGSGETVDGRRYWRSLKKNILASGYTYNGEGVLEVMSQECVAAMARARETRIRNAQRESMGFLRAVRPKSDTPAPAAPTAPQDDPLKGF